MTTKRIVPVGVGVLLLVLIALKFTPSDNRRYRADSLVVAGPLTNALMTRSFEAHVVRTIPGVLRLEATPTFRFPTGSARPASPNAVMIRIIAVGAKPDDAQQVANEAATQLCRTVLTNYGASGMIVDPATSSRSYSYFHDTFQPAIGRIFR